MTSPTSQSGLSAFARCARRYYLRFVRRLEWPAPLTGSEQEWERSLGRGERFHLLVQQQALGMEMDEVVSRLNDAELTQWWDSYRRHPPPVPEGQVHTELELEVSLVTGSRLVARFDRLVIEDDPQGERIHIVDWKTGSSSTAAHLERSWQTAVYRFVALEGSESLVSRRPLPTAVRFVYWQAAAPEEPVVLSYAETDHERVRTRIEAAVADIEERLQHGESAFPRTDDTSACRHCPYRSYCERGREAGPGGDFEAEEEAEGWLRMPSDPEPA